MKRSMSFKLFAALCLLVVATFPVLSQQEPIGVYYVDADKITADYWFTGLGVQGFYVLYAEGKEGRELGQPFFKQDPWIGGLKFSLRAGGIPLPPFDKPYNIKQTFPGDYHETIIVQTKSGYKKVSVTKHPKADTSKMIAKLTGKKAGAEMKVELPAPIIGKGISFKLSFEEAYGKALQDLLYKAKKYRLPPMTPLKFQIYKQHLVPLIGTFPPNFALEVYLIAPWPQDK